MATVTIHREAETGQQYIKLAPLNVELPRIPVAGDILMIATTGSSKKTSYLVIEVVFSQTTGGRRGGLYWITDVYTKKIGERIR